MRYTTLQATSGLLVIMLAVSVHGSPLQLNKLAADDGLRGDRFGNAVDIDGGIALVGAPESNRDGMDSGSAYLFDVATGVQLMQLSVDDTVAMDRFGLSVSLDDGVALVGVPGDDDIGSNTGSAYLFDVTTGSQLAKLTPDIGSQPGTFGQSVSLDGGRALIGAGSDLNGEASGAAFLFDVSSGQQLRRLVPDDVAAFDLFGGAVALDGSLALVASTGDRDNGSQSGSAYVFDAATGAQVAKLVPNDGAERDFFGTSVALFDGIALVGADGDDDNGGSSGSAYLFDARTGTQLAKLTADDGTSNDAFGRYVAIDNGIALVGAVGDDDIDEQSGAAYLFDVATGSLLGKLLPNDGARRDSFGSSVALDDGLAVIGARNADNSSVIDTGVAYVFRAVPEPAAATIAALALSLASHRRL